MAWSAQGLRPVLIAVTLLSPLVARAVSEGELQDGAFARNVLPFYFESRASGFIVGEKGVPLSFIAMEHTNEKGALILLPGRGGSHINFAEFIYDLRDSGWSIYSLDHRGQGFSGRMLDNPKKGHVEDFDHYSKDVKTFMDTVVNARPHQRRVLLGVSMGGAIATTFVQQYPTEVDTLILVVPMHKPNYKPFTEPMAGAIGVAGAATMQSEEYGPTQGDPPEEPEPFEDNRGTHSRVRFDLGEQIHADHPQTLLGGVTFGWAYEVVKATRLMRTRAVEMHLPILLVQAGEDLVVQKDGQDAFCQRTPWCHKSIYEGARHGILSERDGIRDPVMAEIRAFIEEPKVGCSAAGPQGLAPVAMVFVLLGWRRHRRG